MEKVGIIGYGAMGKAFSERMRTTTNINPVVYDVEEGARHQATEDGLQVVSSAAALGESCNIIDIIVRTDEQMLDVTTGPQGLIRAAKPGTVLVLHSSVMPKTTLAIAAKASGHDVEVADACAAGTPDQVRAGNLVFLLGADPELAAKIRPHLLRMARDVIHVGPLGAGNVAKLIKNLVTGSERLVVWEALQIGEKAGISYVNALEMMRLATSNHPRLIEHWEYAFDASGDELDPSCGTNLYPKDIPHVAALARSYGLNLPVTEGLETSSRALVKLNEDRRRNRV